MRILHVNDRLSSRGGADWHLLGVLEALVQEHEVCLAVAVADGTARAPCPVVVVENLDARISAQTRLEEVAGAFRPDVVHLHNVMNPEVLAWARDRPSLMTVQDHRMFCPGRGKLTADGEVCTTRMSPATCRRCFDDEAYFTQIMDVTSRRLDALGALPVTVLSEYMKCELMCVGMASERVTVIPPFVHGMDETGSEPVAGRPCVLFAGRLVEAKGVWDAMNAWRLSGVRLPLVFAGTGRLRNDLEDGGFEVTCWLSHDDLAAYYRAAQAVIFPPRWQEPFGIVGPEALAVGTPVVAWNSGGIVEWHRDEELLVEWGDVEALSRALACAVERTSTQPVADNRNHVMRLLVEVYRQVCYGGGS